MSSAADRFRAHLDECEQCRDNPFSLCGKGSALLQSTAHGELPRKKQPCCPLDTDGDGDCPVHESPGVLRVGTVIHQIVQQERERSKRAFELLADVVEFLNGGYTDGERFKLADKIDEFLSASERSEDRGPVPRGSVCSEGHEFAHDARLDYANQSYCPKCEAHCYVYNPQGEKL